MSKIEKAEFTTMCMVYDDDGHVLVQDRIKKDWPGITFPGGHTEPGETFTDCVIREIKEETGLDIKNPVLCGVKQWQTEENARYIILFFKTKTFSGTLRSSDEGKVFWIDRDRLSDYPLAVDFEDMVRVFESDNLNECYYVKNDKNEWEMKLK